MLDITVVGVGRMGARHAHAAADHPSVNLASVVDLDAERAETVARRHGAGRALTDYERALDDADAAVIATPADAHVEGATAALDRDVDLLLEKPIATDLDAARELARRTATTDAVTGVSFILRYDPGYARARSAIREGDIGRVVAARGMRAIQARNSRRAGARGHPLFYMNVHDIDALEWCLDGRVAEVAAVERRGHLDAEVDVPDATQALLRFESGMIATLEGYGVLPADTPGGIVAAFEAVGTDGRVDVETPGTTLTVHGDQYDRPDTRHWPVVNGRMDGCVRRQFDRFVEAVTGGGELLATVEDGYRAQAVATAIRDALDADGFVGVEER